MSPKYLSDLLKKETGKNTKHHIDDFLINKAKNLLLSSTDPSAAWLMIWDLNILGILQSYLKQKQE